MPKPCNLIIIIIFLATIAKQAISTDSPAIQPTYVIHSCGVENTAGNYTSNSTYETELKNLLSNLKQQAILSYPFFNATSNNQGTTEKVYGQYYCRGNIGPQLCSDCVNDATQHILALCTPYKSAIIWYQECTLSYNNRSMFSENYYNNFVWWFSSENMTSDQQKTMVVLENTMDRIINESAYGNDLRRFAEETGKVSEFETIYCQVQCSPDLNGTQCDTCLRSLLMQILGDWGFAWMYVFHSSCQMMYTVNTTLYDISPSPHDQPPIESPSKLPPPPTVDSAGKANKYAVFVAVPVVVLLLLSVVGFWAYKKNRHREYDDHMAEIGKAESLQFDISTIRIATDNFSDASKLGEGGFGSVYKGRLQNGQEVAVKRLFQKSNQPGVEEFKTEVLVVAKLQHRNLVKLLGYCLTGREKLLIFELLPNSSLDHFLYDAIKRASLDWKTRYNIIVGVARGLLYLHEESRLKIIHRDLKPNNILLDEAMNPKIADFGLAKSFNLDQSMANTQNIVGTYGYMSPEYAMAGHFSTKSDVYSFGVIVLEIVTGKRNIIQENQPSLFHHVWTLWNEGNALDILDPTLLNNYSTEEAMGCIHIGLLCIQEEPGSRPNMAKVVSVLNGHSTALPQPSPPLIFTFSEGDSGIKYSSALITQGSQEQQTGEQSSISAPVTDDDAFHPR